MVADFWWVTGNSKWKFSLHNCIKINDEHCIFEVMKQKSRGKGSGCVKGQHICHANKWANVLVEPVLAA
jgi:hypothetical protein